VSVISSGVGRCESPHLTQYACPAAASRALRIAARRRGDLRRKKISLAIADARTGEIDQRRADEPAIARAALAQDSPLDVRSQRGFGRPTTSDPDTPCAARLGYRRPMIERPDSPGEVAARTSEAEARFDRIRARIGAVLAPVVLLGLLITPIPGLSPEAHRLTAIAAMTVILWISEAIPLAVSALLAPALAVLFDVAPAQQVFAPFAHPLIFLFLGGFMLAEALAVQGFDRRAALWLLSRDLLRGSPARAMVAVAITAFVFSMWINNTATTAMMIPIALGLCASIRRLCPPDPELQARHRRYEEGMLITLAYASSLGGICTPIGTAPNMIAIGYLDRFAGVRIDFLQWMSFGVPVGLAALAGTLVFARLRWPPALERVEGLTATVRRDLEALGPMTPGERRSVAVFGIAIAGWLAPSLLRLWLGQDAPATAWAQRALTEGVVALIAASLLFVLPSGDSNAKNTTIENHPIQGTKVAEVEAIAPAQTASTFRWTPLLSWTRATRIDWGTLFLLGGGLALGELTVSTGLAAALGDAVGARLGSQVSPLLLLVVVTTLVIYLTELVSNTATTNMMLPIVIPLATEGGMDPVPASLAVTLAASFAFMLPVSTPPNAIAYGTGLVRLPTMVRFGARLDLFGLVLLVAVGAWLLPAMRFW
jgi:solute carrier family 13 (sodium-dependent dicarboxylate transporter), member 2/3/5